MRKKIVKRAFLVVLAAALIGNSLQLPESIVLANEVEANTEGSIAEMISGYLHIGQTQNMEEPVYPDDNEIIENADNTDNIYDKPIIIKPDDQMRLFADPQRTVALDRDGEGVLTWGILRADAGTEPGTVNILNGEDDWTAFETVSKAPHFTVEEENDKDSVFYKTLVVTAEDLTAGDGCDYYIRAEFRYTKEGREYTALTTVPVITAETAAEDSMEEAGAEEEVPATEPEEDSEKAVQKDIAEEAEEQTGEIEEAAEKTKEAEGQQEDAEEEEEQPEGEEAAEKIEVQTEDVEEEKEQPEEAEMAEGQTEEIKVSKLILNKTGLTMHPGNMAELSASVVPEGLGRPVIWSIRSGSDSVVVFAGEESIVGEKAVDEGTVVTIEAKSEGRCEVTAECGGKTAVVKIEVVQTDVDVNNDRPRNEEGDLIAISDEVWVAGFEKESDVLTYTGSKITQNLRIYHKETLLKEKTDYTLTYKNNVNAAAYDSAKAPSVTVTMKGQYSGGRTLYYTIVPREIDEDRTMGYEQVVSYAKDLKIPAPTLYYNQKKLTLNKDFVCDYTAYNGDSVYSRMPENYTKGDAYEDGRVYEYTVYGKGNFTGSFQMRLAVIRDKNFNLGSATVTLDQKQYEYCGRGLSRDDVRITAVKCGKEVVNAEYYDYEVHAESVGTGSIEIKPSDAGRIAGYRGMKKVDIKVVGDRKIKDAVMGNGWQPTITFLQQSVHIDGGIMQAKEGVLVYSGAVAEPLKEGEDYTVKYTGHKKVGTATVTFVGMGRYTGSFKKTYRIVPNTEVDIVWHETDHWNDTDEEKKPVATYRKGGAIPQFDLAEKASGNAPCVLSSKTDYSVKYRNNNQPGIMTCEITGKGNYKGYKSITQVKVLSADISMGTISAADKQYSTKAGAWKASVTIKDVNGKKLKAGTDYEKTLLYRYAGMENELPPQPDTFVYVTAVGINHYEGSSITGSYRIYNTNISKLTVVIDAQEYTGREIELSPDAIHVYANKNDAKKGIEIESPCYKVVSYSNNIKAGKAKVTLRGIGNYGGTRTCTFKIQKKTFLTTRVNKITLHETSVTLGVGRSRKLTATLVPEDAFNQTVIWSTSNSKIATVENGLVTAKEKTGKVTITATSQDTGKKATCKVTVAVIPVVSFALSETRIEGDEGTSQQLTVLDIQPQYAALDTIRWESGNPEIASVDAKGMVSLNTAGMTVIKAYADEDRFVAKCLVVVNSMKEEAVPEVPYLTPQMYRTYDDENDTEAINKAIRDLKPQGCDTVFLPAGTYRIDATEGIKILPENSNMKLVMSPDAVLKAIGNSSEFYDLIHVNGAGNVRICGGQIIGERYEHIGNSGEWGQGIGIYGCSSVSIIGVDISGCWGDGIYLGSHNDEDPAAGNSYITIADCNLHHNRRNNLSVVYADYVTVERCRFDHAGGTAPGFGIDIETNSPDNPCEHIEISDSSFDGNAQAGIGIITEADDIRITGCTLNGAFINYAGTNVRVYNTMLSGEVNARIGLLMDGETKINDGGDEEDILVASFSAADCPYPFDASHPDEYAPCKYTFRRYEEDSISCEIYEDNDSFSGKALCLKREVQGTKEAGWYLNLEELTQDKSSLLEKGAVYRFEYVVKGSGQWGIKTSQTGWYPCLPMQDKYSTGIVTYEADSAESCRLMLYAVDRINGMELKIDSIKIYKVR